MTGRWKKRAIQAEAEVKNLWKERDALYDSLAEAEGLASEYCSLLVVANAEAEHLWAHLAEVHHCQHDLRAAADDGEGTT